MCVVARPHCTGSGKSLHYQIPQCPHPFPSDPRQPAVNHVLIDTPELLCVCIGRGLYASPLYCVARSHNCLWFGNCVQNSQLPFFLESLTLFKREVKSGCLGGKKLVVVVHWMMLQSSVLSVQWMIAVIWKSSLTPQWVIVSYLRFTMRKSEEKFQFCVFLKLDALTLPGYFYKMLSSAFNLARRSCVSESVYVACNGVRKAGIIWFRRKENFIFTKSLGFCPNQSIRSQREWGQVGNIWHWFAFLVVATTTPRICGRPGIACEKSSEAEDKWVLWHSPPSSSPGNLL